MARLVNADALAFAYLSAQYETDITKELTAERVANTIISLSQEMDNYTPIVHAHWVFDGLDSLECSKCHWGWSVLYANGDWQSDTTYCPDCGALMDEEVE